MFDAARQSGITCKLPPRVSRVLRLGARSKRAPAETLNPEQRLADRVVADDLRISRIRVKSLPQREGFQVCASKAAEEKARRAYRQGVEVFHILCVRPVLLILQIREEKGHALANAAAIVSCEAKHILARHAE